MKHFLVSLLALTLFISCSKNSDEIVDYTAKNEQEIVDYLAKNNLTAKRTESGLYYIINEEGEGEHPTATSNVTVAYTGYFTNKQIFDKSDATGVSFSLNRVIRGWTEGIPYFKKGGSGILLIPSHLGYGNNNQGTIPGGSVLIFEVKLISFN